MTETKGAHFHARVSTALLLSLWSLNATGEFPTMTQVIKHAESADTLPRNMLESRRQLIRNMMKRDYVTSVGFLPYRGHKLQITALGISFLKAHGYPVDVPKES